MRTIPPALAAHMQLGSTTLAICWQVEKLDGSFVRGTEHDVDIAFAPSPDPLGLTGAYLSASGVTATNVKASSDMSVDNMEVAGAFPVAPLVVAVNLNDVNAGLLNGAPVTVFVVNWRSPADGHFIYLRGYLGQISHDSDGGFTTEVRSLGQLLTQNVCQSYNERCNVVQFGDARCKFPVETTRIAGIVTTITSRRLLGVSLALGSPAPAWTYTGGLLTFTTGANRTFSREIKLDPAVQPSRLLELWDPLPEDAQVGDSFTAVAGCDRTAQMCRDVYANLANFRGYGLFVPLVAQLTQGTTTPLDQSYVAPLTTGP